MNLTSETCLTCTTIDLLGAGEVQVAQFPDNKVEVHLSGWGSQQHADRLIRLIEKIGRLSFSWAQMWHREGNKWVRRGTASNFLDLADALFAFFGPDSPSCTLRTNPSWWEEWNRCRVSAGR